ncbi:DNA primase [Pedobacter heparinus]|uniref:DNA primase n=1 Tax=Pedobacter heparinus (strain ATCC 13125 / DSM 2366 / CIP 104194 / JCM 7457 / NBRC 12017 / NCIMB 9290 / NRRL B-14731 / HIM 762-3) TaxID=485917 RepID=C6XZ19_PEDHD|nr:DNA primase [Pedobacter heparinus]ACU02501.1 DNA primase [Pedobacter heparinus DSM 2366]
MINQDTINKIMDTARIEEVVGDFVALKKRGTSLIGNCPFHNEKTPSFNVSVTKGIYKCFGCGKGGDAVHFIMDHEKYSYPEALKYLAQKYNIEVEETVQSPQNIEAQNARESLYIVSEYAAGYFANELWTGNDGRAIGLSYFKERGFREDILKKFQLGYSPDVWDALIQNAVGAGHKEEYLEKTGLAIRNDKGKLYDRFRGRVMFPIHNFTGRVIGFGGRTLKTDKNVPKYVNSPESDIYHKSNVLYGLYHAKKAIRDQDNCYLVEGYADVLAVHQAGIENVVASSGTSLTTEQIRLIGRFTENVTILYDGDAAGIKASLRGLDMILEEGLNVKVVLFPDGHDPDSYMHHVGSGEFKQYIEGNRRDFILYKATILLKEAGTDPIKRAGIIRDIIESIAKIPDDIKAAVFIRECSSLLQVEERILLSELNKMRAAKLKKASGGSSSPQSQSFQQHQQAQQHAEGPPDNLFENPGPYEDPGPETAASNDLIQEQEIVRLLLAYGHELVNWDGIDNMYIGSFIIQNLTDVVFEDQLCSGIIENYREEIENGHLPVASQFIKSPDRNIAELAITLSTSPYILSENWENKHNIYVRDETVNLKATILGGLFHLKKTKIAGILSAISKEIKTETDPVNLEILMQRFVLMKGVEREISKHLGITILK